MPDCPSFSLARARTKTARAFSGRSFIDFVQIQDRPRIFVGLETRRAQAEERIRAIRLADRSRSKSPLPAAARICPRPAGRPLPLSDTAAPSSPAGRRSTMANRNRGTAQTSARHRPDGPRGRRSSRAKAGRPRPAPGIRRQAYPYAEHSGTARGFFQIVRHAGVGIAVGQQMRGVPGARAALTIPGRDDSPFFTRSGQVSIAFSKSCAASRNSTRLPFSVPLINSQ